MIRDLTLAWLSSPRAHFHRVTPVLATQGKDVPVHDADWESVEDVEPAGLADRQREFGVGDQVHGGKDNWVLNTQEFRQLS
jgi:hypothetical protein